MPLFTFRVCWEEDDLIYRDITLKSGQTFDTFQSVILKSYEFNENKPASFFESNESWLPGREISSEVLVNKKDAAALSMIKTPVSALVNQPEKRFLFQYDPEKKWHFQITLIALEKDKEFDDAVYPLIVKTEGISPKTVGVHNSLKENISQTEDQFDLNSEDMDEQGFGEEPGF